MAKLKNGTAISGTLGNLIYYQRGDTACVRLRPEKVRQPNTPAQLLAREKFKKAAALARELNRSGMPVGAEAVPGKLAGNYQRALALVRNFGFLETNGVLEWNWAGLLIANGSLPEPAITVQKKPGQQIFNWQTAPVRPENTQLILLSIAPSDLTVAVLSTPFSKGSCIWNPEPEAHVYGFIAAPKTGLFRVSRSVYLGRVEGA